MTYKGKNMEEKIRERTKEGEEKGGGGCRGRQRGIKTKKKRTMKIMYTHMMHKYIREYYNNNR